MPKYSHRTTSRYRETVDMYKSIVPMNRSSSMVKDMLIGTSIHVSIHHSTWCTEHPYPTHSLSESVDMLVCLGSHYLYTYAHCSLSVCIHTCMTSIMLRPLASHTHTTVPVACVHTSTLVLLPRLSFSLYVYHTYLYTYLCMCTCVPYSTRSVPHHTVPQYWYSATYTYTCVFPSIHIVYILVQA